MKEKVIVDLDETVVDFLTPLFQIYNADSEIKVDTSTIKEYNLGKCADLDKLYKIWSSDGFFSSLKPYPNAIETLKKLDKKYHLIIATKPTNIQTALEKYIWCKNNLPFIPFDDITMSSYKYLLDAQYLIDDCPDYLIKFNGTSICMNKSYNQNIFMDYRVNNWDEIAHILL